MHDGRGISGSIVVYAAPSREPVKRLALGSFFFPAGIAFICFFFFSARWCRQMEMTQPYIYRVAFSFLRLSSLPRGSPLPYQGPSLFRFASASSCRLEEGKDAIMGCPGRHLDS